MSLDEVLQQQDQRVNQIIQSSLPGTFLIFTTGSGNTSLVKRFVGVASSFLSFPIVLDRSFGFVLGLQSERPGNRSPTWNEVDEYRLETAVLNGRKGLTFYYMT